MPELHWHHIWFPEAKHIGRPHTPVLSSNLDSRLHEKQIREKSIIILDIKSNQVKRTPQESINEFIIQKLNPLLVVDFRLISAFLYV